MQSSVENPVALGRSLRRQQIALLLGFGLGSLAWNFCWPFLPLQVQAVGITELGEVARFAGLLAGLTNLITASLGPFWILLGERFGYKKQVMRAHLGTSVSMSLVGLARTPLQLGAAAVVLGSFGGNYPHYLALAAASASPAEVGQIVGDLQAAGQAGSTLGPIVGGLVAAQLGLPASFFLSTAVSFLGFLVATFGIRADASRAPGRPRPKGGLRQAIARPDHRWLMLLFPIADAGVQGLRPLIPVVISTRSSDPAAIATETGLTATLAMAGTVVSALVVGRLSKRISPRWIMSFTLPASTVCALMVPLARDFPTLLLAWSVMGLMTGATTPAIFAWMGRLSPGGAGSYAVLATVNMVDFAIGPAVMGQASIYSLDLPFRIAALTTLIGAVVVFVSSPRDVAPPATDGSI
jgi:DHA1 family multidrug resistance protein-like MFS transporter